MTPEQIAEEYELVCEEMARKGRTGKIGDQLPTLISREVSESIHCDLYAFQSRIRDHAFAMAMARSQKKITDNKS